LLVSVLIREMWHKQREINVLPFSPGDWDAARKKWTGSVCHLWCKGNPFFILHNEELNMTVWIPAQPLLLCHTPFCKMSSITLLHLPLMCVFVLFESSHLCCMLHVFFFFPLCSIKSPHLRNTESAKING